MKSPLSMSAACGRSTRFGFLVTVPWWPRRRPALLGPRPAITLPSWRESFTCQSKSPCCSWSNKTGSPARRSPAYIGTALATLQRGSSSCKRGKCCWSRPPQRPRSLPPMNCGRRRLSCLPACSTKNNGRQIADLLHLDPHTVAKGPRQLLAQELKVGRVRGVGGGRKPLEKKRLR